MGSLQQPHMIKATMILPKASGGSHVLEALWGAAVPGLGLLV